MKRLIPILFCLLISCISAKAQDQEYDATSVQANVKNGVATVTLTFPQIRK